MSRALGLAVFDIDGTLTDTSAVDAECYVSAVRQEIGLEVSEDWASLNEVTDTAILRALCEAHGRPLEDGLEGRVARRLADLLAAAHVEAPGRFRPIPGAPWVFEVLVRSGWAVAMATGAWRPSALFKLRAAGIPHEGVPLATSSEHGARPDIIRLAVSISGADPATPVVYLGDGVWDGRAAFRLGIPFVGVGGGGREEILRRAGARAVLRDFADGDAVLEVLEGCVGGRR